MATKSSDTTLHPGRPAAPVPAQGEFDPNNPATFPYHGDPNAVVKTGGPVDGERVQTNEPSNWSNDDPKHLILVGGVPGLPIGDPEEGVRQLLASQWSDLEAARKASRGKGGRDAQPGVLDIQPPPLPKMPDWLQPGVPPPPGAAPDGSHPNR